MNKLSNIVREQFPEVIQTDYPLFVSFLEAYYEYMDTTMAGKIGHVKDIDLTLDQFIVNFKKDFALNIPAFPFITEKEFLRNAKEFYASRGSEASYKFLLKILFGKESEIFYPETTLLRASDGRWIQDISVQVKIISGDVNSIIGKTVRVVLNETILFLSVLKTKRITDILFEIFIERPQFGEPMPGAILSFEGFSGTIMPVLGAITVVTPGSGFKVGQFYDLSTPTGKNAKIRLIAVDANKGAKTFQIVKYGQGFNSSSFNSVLKSGVTTADITTIPPIDDTLGPIVDSGFVTRSNFFLSDFAEPSYSAIVLASFDSSLGTLFVVDSDLTSTFSAVIKVNISGLSKYPGFYSESRGFLSDIIKLQDNYYHQLYAYVVKIDEQLNSYRSIIKSLLHPAGMELFGEFNKNSLLNLAPSLRQLNAMQQLLLQELLVVTQFRSFNTNKPLSDILDFTDDDIYQFIKILQDTLSFDDDDVLDTNKVFIDQLEFADDDILDINKSLQDEVTISENNILDTDKILDDELFVTDFIGANYSKEVFGDELLFTDLETLLIVKDFSDQLEFTDSNTESIEKDQIISTLEFTDELSRQWTAFLAADETIIISDVNNEDINKQITDNLLHTDAGVLILSPAADYGLGVIGTTSFFSEDYTMPLPSSTQATW